MPCRSSYILFYILWVSLPLFSQSPQTLTYTISDGMPMTEISTVHCDRDGRIWSIHNNAWISCFDGRRFTNYSPETTGHYTASGLFNQDRHGMWLLNPGKSISLFTDGKWKSWRDHAFTGAVVDKASDQIVIIDAAGTFYLFDTTTESWIATARVPGVSDTTHYSYELSMSLDEDKYLLKRRDMLSHEVLNTYQCTSFISPNWVEKAEMQNVLHFWSEGKLVTSANPTDLFVQVGFESLPDLTFGYGFVDGHTLILSAVSPAKTSKAWLVEIYVFESPSVLRPLCQFLHPHHSISFTRDHEGHLWAGSQGGLTHIFPEIMSFPEDNAPMISGLHAINEDDRGRVWLGGYTSGLCYYDDAGLHAPPDDAALFKRFLPAAFNNSAGDMAFWTEDYGIITYSEGAWNHTERHNYASTNQHGYYFLAFADSLIAGGLMNEGLGIAPLPITPEIQWRKINKSKGLLLDNVLTISEDRAGRLWTGRSSQGIALYDPVLDTAQTWLRAGNIGKGFGTTSSLVDHNGTLWLGCNDGLRYLPDAHRFRMFEEDLFDKAIPISMDEAGTTSVSLVKEYQGFLIFGNKQGYGFLDLTSQTTNPERPKIYFYPTDKFLKSPDQNTILIDSKGYIWIGQDLGATRIDLEHLVLDTLPVHMIIDCVRAGGENIAASDVAAHISGTTVRLPTHKRNLEIFLSPSFTGLLRDNVGFQYRLMHKNIRDTTWSQYAKNDHLVFSYLPPGNNRIELRAIKNNQIADTILLSFDVPLSLSENPWFWICLIGGLSLSGVIITWRFYRQQLSIRQTRLALKEKELALSEHEREKEQLQIKAIANSLNPHFINNSLQWLQSRVRKDPEAVRMIDRFSKNIRTVFVNSRNGKAYHSLGDEIELVKNYLYIQKSRYGDFVDVTMPSDEIIASLSGVQVPLMQIQIHVENAIEHGIRHRDGARKLSIQIQENGTYLYIDIADDGVGRHRSEEIGSHGTQQGTQMLKSLHAIFNKHNRLPIVSTYRDTPVTDPDTGEQYGTTVHIEIPKAYRYELTED